MITKDDMNSQVKVLLGVYVEDVSGFQIFY